MSYKIGEDGSISCGRCNEELNANIILNWHFTWHDDGTTMRDRYGSVIHQCFLVNFPELEDSLKRKINLLAEMTK